MRKIFNWPILAALLPAIFLAVAVTAPAIADDDDEGFATHSFGVGGDVNAVFRIPTAGVFAEPYDIDLTFETGDDAQDVAFQYTVNFEHVPSRLGRPKEYPHRVTYSPDDGRVGNSGNFGFTSMDPGLHRIKIDVTDDGYLPVEIGTTGWIEVSVPHTSAEGQFVYINPRLVSVVRADYANGTMTYLMSGGETIKRPLTPSEQLAGDYGRLVVDPYHHAKHFWDVTEAD